MFSSTSYVHELKSFEPLQAHTSVLREPAVSTNRQETRRSSHPGRPPPPRTMGRILHRHRSRHLRYNRYSKDPLECLRHLRNSIRSRHNHRLPRRLELLGRDLHHLRGVRPGSQLGPSVPVRCGFPLVHHVHVPQLGSTVGSGSTCLPCCRLYPLYICLLQVRRDDSREMPICR